MLFAIWFPLLVAFTELVGQLGGSELMASTLFVSPVLAGNSPVWPLPPNPWALSLVLSEYLWISQGTPSTSRIILPWRGPWRWGNSCATVQATHADGTSSLQPFFKSIKVFFPGVLELSRAGEPKPIGCWVAVWSDTVPGLPHRDIPSPSTLSRGSFFSGKHGNCSWYKYRFLFFFYCGSMFLSNAVGAKIKKCNILFFEILLSRDMGSKASAAAQTKAWGFSISCCNPCMGPVSLPVPLKHLLNPSLPPDWAD